MCGSFSLSKTCQLHSKSDSSSGGVIYLFKLTQSFMLFVKHSLYPSILCHLPPL